MNRYPLLIMVVMLGLCWGVSRLYPLTSGLAVVEKGLGWLVMLCGIALLAVAAGLFRIKGTTVNPTKEPNNLVTGGVYRVTRNPMYLGMLMILIGFPFVAGSLAGLIFPVFFFIFIDRVVIPKEEKVVERVFGDAYREYQSQTRRWFGMSGIL
ncbi:MAG: methyltransferase family protein [Syntrophales bacterium]